MTTSDTPFADLPEDVRPFAVQTAARNRACGLEPDEDVVRMIAWMQWGQSMSNDELADWLGVLANELVMAGDNPVSVRLREIQYRLRKIRRKKK